MTCMLMLPLATNLDAVKDKIPADAWPILIVALVVLVIAFVVRKVVKLMVVLLVVAIAIGIFAAYRFGAFT
jgi:hypothetical protein